ncbi:MAG: hypothetical protein AB8B56_21165 [Crocinitomicaceae bacterium]
MKSILFALFLTGLYISTGCATQKNVYTVLSDETFKEIEAKVHQQEDWNPIRIEGYSKAELVSFYIQSYSDDIVETWADMAYKKMHRFEKANPTEKQDSEFKKLMALPRTRENMHQFMMLMTENQIETVGY